MSQATALIDGNNFYASCEQSLDPALIGHPVVVLSNNDGCIVARSAEAPLRSPQYSVWDQVPPPSVQASKDRVARTKRVCVRKRRIRVVCVCGYPRGGRYAYCSSPPRGRCTSRCARPHPPREP